MILTTIFSIVYMRELSNKPPVPSLMEPIPEAEPVHIITLAKPVPEPLITEESEPEFIQAFIYDMSIDLPYEYQEHTYRLCEQYGIEEHYDVVMTIMWHESRYVVDVPDNINQNGSRDRGLMQINSCNWSWLSDEGFDISDPFDNIEAGILMVSRLFDKSYTVEQVLAAYAAGEAGMMQGKGYWFTERILALCGMSKES